MDSLHFTIWWNYIDLHFNIRDYCNVICIIFMYKLFLFNKINFFFNSILILYTSKFHIYYSSNSNIESTNISLSTDVFLLDHIYINYTYKITLKCIFLLILSFFFKFFQVFLWILNNFCSTKKYPSIFLIYFRYIHKIEVPIYP